MAPTSDKPVFDPKEVLVIFVLGGPGAGKGTQCEKLVNEFSFVHLSAGDLLRAEQEREGSQYGALIREHIREGIIVPMEVTLKLLENAMQPAVDQGRKRFLIDGFPRKMDQAIKFDESVCPSSLILYLTCTEEIMLGRLLERGKTSGRADDNRESITKRFRTFVETSMPVIDYYKKKNPDAVLEADSTKSVDEVYAQLSGPIRKLIQSKNQ